MKDKQRRKVADEKVPARIIGYERKGARRLPIYERLDEPSWVPPDQWED